jgi:glutamyl-tRNA reductase
MHILVVGLNYKTAPVEIREKVAFQPAEIQDAISLLRKQKSILECVIVSTCNRTEIYAVADQLHTGRYYIKSFLADWFNIEKEELSPFLSIRDGEAAVEHLFRVSAGLDSMVIGETQILGQVKDSFLESQKLSATGTIFNKLMKQAITFAKKCHSETDIGENAVSVSYAAVELAKKIFGGLQNKTILIVGAGKMGELTAKHLHASGGNEVLVINRTFDKAKEVAEKFHGVAHPFSDLDKLLVKADIVISSTGASDFVITKEMAAPAIKKRKGLPLFMVDIAVPRDLDPALHDLDSVFLYDIDDLEGIVESNLAERKKEAEKIEILIESEIVDFQSWISMLGVVPLISALREKALNIQAETMQSIERKMPDLTDREKKILSKHTKSIVNQLLRDPVTRAKEIAGQADAEEQLQLFTEIFALEDYLDKQKQSETGFAANREDKASLADEAVNPFTART